ncbi:unnamed protein product [Aureobasidium uvarum]|uniref:EKC/KEOPS complex subunit BUD32 n=1 Tax=Aureobasidium uvarum TaxID=2773716 RepID=A0A9N8PR61_9PEZI|nr:unnamed protein product [Aureobasidium uvarum]
MTQFPSGSLDLATNVINRGSTAVIKRYQSDIVIKCVNRPSEHDSIDYFEIGKQILDILRPHPRIIKFLGSSQTPKGLLFAEANHGDLQCYLDSHNESINDDLRLKWRLQAAEAVAYLRSKGVIHSDLRPQNFLLHIDNDNDGPELLLCDFGGSYCKTSDRIIDGGHLPDTGFFNPTKEWISTKDTDIFALGSVFYAVMTGHWLYKSPGPFVSVEEQEQYDERVNELFMKRAFPPVEHLLGGDIIHECWTEKITHAGTIVSRHKSLIPPKEGGIEERT